MSQLPNPALHLAPAGLDMDDYNKLWVAALAARKQAYVRYSSFKVGAALLDDQNNIHAGCNVENAAYPQGVCAEAGAISAMVLSGGRSIRALLVLGAATDWVTPCGGCRQKIREFASDDTPILIANPKLGWQTTLTLGALLPHSFGPNHLLNNPTKA